MKNYNQLEVLLFVKYSFKDHQQKELIKWLGTSLQSSIGKQQELTKKLVLKNLRNTPPIYLS
jgi:hypothetical protein